jgi:hypothetical protein
MTAWLVTSPQRLALDGDVTELHVWLASGKLRVVGTDGPARIEATRVGRKGIAVTLENGTLSIRHDLPSTWWKKFGPLWWFASGWRHYNAHLTIAVPPTAAADLTLVSGSVVASGLRRGVMVDVTSGSISLMGVGGTVRAKTISGSVHAVGVGGDLGLETVSGEITVAESSAERVYARTISGSVTCDLDNPFARDVGLETTSGEITVRVPIDADLDARLSAVSGRVTSAFSEVRGNNGAGWHNASGRIGAGTGRLNAHAVSGSVSLLARATEDFSAPGETGAP